MNSGAGRYAPSPDRRPAPRQPPHRPAGLAVRPLQRSTVPAPLRGSRREPGPARRRRAAASRSGGPRAGLRPAGPGAVRTVRRVRRRPEPTGRTDVRVLLHPTRDRRGRVGAARRARSLPGDLPGPDRGGARRAPPVGPVARPADPGRRGDDDDHRPPARPGDGPGRGRRGAPPGGPAVRGRRCGVPAGGGGRRRRLRGGSGGAGRGPALLRADPGLARHPTRAAGADLRPRAAGPQRRRAAAGQARRRGHRGRSGSARLDARPGAGPAGHLTRAGRARRTGLATDLLARFDPTRLPREPWIVRPDQLVPAE